jgi:hypothetical protein
MLQLMAQLVHGLHKLSMTLKGNNTIPHYKTNFFSILMLVAAAQARCVSDAVAAVEQLQLRSCNNALQLLAFQK